MAGEKRTQEKEETLLSQTTILLDIEGTTSSISFVKETLFPYVREHLKTYVASKWEDEEFKKDLEKLKEQAKKDEEDKVDGVVPITGATPEEEKEALIKNVFWQMDGDRKTGALKQLQGHVWREAYASGAIKGHIYEDVPKALESWTDDGRKVYIYSSGSVEAQKLLFGHTTCGDLLKHFSGYFDTEIGTKQEASSYKNITSKIGVEPSSVLFLTDVVKEAKAAKEAGLSAIIVVREGNAPLTDDERVEFTNVKSFLDLSFQTSSKRQKLDTHETQEKDAKGTGESTEPMDTTEDVEMFDVSEKKTETEAKKEVVTDEKATKQETAATASKSADEPMITDTKESTPTDKAKESDRPEKSETQVKPAEVSKLVDSSENASPTTNDTANTASLTKDDADKKSSSETTSDKVPEKVEKVGDTVSQETSAKTNDSMDTATCESKSKPAEASNATESKSNETNASAEAKAETAVSSKSAVADEGPKEKISDKNPEEKVAEPAEPAKDQVSEKSTDSTVPASTTESKKPENVDAKMTNVGHDSAKPEEKSTAKDVTENGDVPATKVEKSAASTIAEPEAKKEESQGKASEGTAEAKSESQGKVNETPSPKAAEAEKAEKTPVATAKETEEKEASGEVSKAESKEEPTKEETVVAEVKDNSTVDGEKKNINGTTQNGDTEVVPVSDDKLHSNGLNEGPSSESLDSAKSESTSAQNGEAESSSDATAESIKVKKVVDSTVADGAGEPDVVPPVVVAATS